jgi:mono/diheme cytochrome c family protein
VRHGFLLGCAVAAAALARFEQGAASLPRADVQHGRYLVEHVAMCIECHSPRGENGELVENEEFRGAPIPVRAPPWAGEWAIQAPRIRGLPSYDDAAALRLLMDGSIGRDGRRLKPPMPPFRMSRQDAADVIAFLREQH